jgi:hypothetical protein
MAFCGRLAIGLGLCGQVKRPVANRPQDAILPHNETCPTA